MSLQALVGADETAYAVAGRTLVANALCQADAAVLGAIDEDAARQIVGAEKVVHGLDKDTHGTHEQRSRDDEDEHQSGAAQEYLIIFRHKEIACVCDDGAYAHCIEDAYEVDEATEAEDAAVGVEEAEGNGVGYEQY